MKAVNGILTNGLLEVTDEVFIDNKPKKVVVVFMDDDSQIEPSHLEVAKLQEKSGFVASVLADQEEDVWNDL